MKTKKVRRISRRVGKVSTAIKGNVDGLMVVDGTEVQKHPSDQLTAELSLEKGIAKLKEEHRVVLAKLHEEVDKLKRHNQELQFLIAFNDAKTLGTEATVACQMRHQTGNLTGLQAAVEKSRVHSAKRVTPRSKSGVQPAQPASQNHETLAAAAGEVSRTPATLRRLMIGELKRNLKDEKCRNVELIDKLAADNARIILQESENSLTESHIGKLNPSIKKTSKKPDNKRSCPLPFDAKLEPFLVHNERPPTAEECETIIKALKERVDKQSDEITSIRTDLKDVIETHKLTPESFLLAKYYAQDTSICSNIVECTCNQRKSSGRQPMVVSLPDHGQLPAEKINQRIRKPALLFRQIACRPLVR